MSNYLTAETNEKNRLWKPIARRIYFLLVTAAYLVQRIHVFRSR